MPPETKLEKSERYVREGEEHVTSQKEIVARLKATGRKTRDSQALLVITRPGQRDDRSWPIPVTPQLKLQAG